MRSKQIKDNFTKASLDYEQLADIQYQLGLELIEQAVSDGLRPKHILDIGCGPGNVTKRIRTAFKEALITGADFSEGMIARARQSCPGVSFVAADVLSLPFENKLFDMVFSNLMFQWVTDKQKAFNEISRVLAPGGYFYFTAFTPGTLAELKKSFGFKTPLDSQPYQKDMICDLENAGFGIIGHSVKISKQTYKDMTTLVRWLKRTGASQIGYRLTRGLGIRKYWREAEKNYEKKFRSFDGTIAATFESLTIRAKKL